MRFIGGSLDGREIEVGNSIRLFDQPGSGEVYECRKYVVALPAGLIQMRVAVLNSMLADEVSGAVKKLAAGLRASPVT